MDIAHRIFCGWATSHKMNLSKLSQLALILALFCCYAQAAHAASLAASETNTDPLKYLSQINRPVFFVRLFGKDFPIPTRFEYMPDSHPPGVMAEFQSPNGTILRSQLLPDATGPRLMQWIDVGLYENYQKEISRHPPTGKDLIKKFECYGFSVEVRVALTGVRAQADQIVVVIHNGDEYIDFVGKHSDVLAKELLRFYGALNDLSIGDNCKFLSRT